eukprot:Gb_13740 [translate_table: standard]
MRSICDLEVNVNGEQTFFVDKKTLVSFSGRLIKLFKKTVSAPPVKSYKVILHDLPGGPEAFELVSRFCYNRANIQINHNNICVLRCVAEFLEMTEEIYSGNLVEQTEHFLKGMAFWSWREVLNTLKQCEVLVPTADAAGIIQRCIDALVARINACSDISPVSSSPESSGFRYSSDTRSSESSKHGCKSGWWFQDLSSLSIYLMERTVKTMIAHNTDNCVVSRFLFHYLRSSLPMLGYSSISPKKKCGRDEEIIHQYTQKVQREVLETVVNLLHCLERTAVSCRCLFGILRVASVLNASNFCRKQLESMIGSQLDQATLDNILIPAPQGIGCLYDVDLVLRFVQIFLKDHLDSMLESPRDHQMPSSSTPSSICFQTGLKRVGSLMDKYITEVAPDVNLKPSKFQALVEALPDDARKSCDVLYRALEMYLEVHPRLSAEEGMELCKSINYQKLSLEACKHVAQNPRVPARIAMQVLLLQQAKLRCALDSHYVKSSVSSPSSRDNRIGFDEEEEDGDSNRAILYLKQLEYSSVICEENQELKADLQGMQCRVMELEKICKKMHSQMSKLVKLKPKNNSSSNHRLPKLCS